MPVPTVPSPCSAASAGGRAVAIQCSVHRDRSGAAALPLYNPALTPPSENPIVMRTRDIDLDVPASLPTFPVASRSRTSLTC